MSPHVSRRVPGAPTPQERDTGQSVEQLASSASEDAGDDVASGGGGEPAATPGARQSPDGAGQGNQDHDPAGDLAPGH